VITGDIRMRVSDAWMERIIHQKEDGWYYWSETWTDEHGPFDSSEEAQYFLYVYAYYLDTGLFIF
jgi:hypothetical protein